MLAIREHFATPAADPDRAAVEEAAATPDPARALAILRKHFGPAAAPDLQPVANWHDHPKPAPVLWRDDPAAGLTTTANAVLSIGEVALLSAPGGTGKSYLTLALARAAAMAHADEGVRPGTACGLRVRAGPVVLVSYEDVPVRMAARLEAMGGAPAHVHCWPDPGPLLVAGGERTRGAARPCDTWQDLWKAIQNVSPSMVVIDPATAALSGVSVSEGGPVRAFLQGLAREAEAASCGVLVVAHHTKADRNEVRAGPPRGRRRPRRRRGGR